ncbi:MAG: DUF6600 domain-containing protein [Pseudomonadota bacterium]
MRAFSRPLSCAPTWLRSAALGAALLLGTACALAQADPPGRVGRIEATEGAVSFQPASDGQARAADPRWPLTAGDQVWTDPASRAEVQLGAATLRLGNGAAIELTALDDLAAQVKLTGGTLGLVVRDLQPGERFEVDTPNLALLLSTPGRWRIDVEPGQGLTRVFAEDGSATLYGGNGESVAMGSGQRRDFTGRGLASPAPLAVVAGDAFDRWSNERDRIESRSVASRYVSPDMPGAQQLDGYGDWGNDPSYGPIWYPRAVADDWAPYRYGHWEWIEPWGWTWIDDAPWGFAPFHYGRWAQSGNRWGWVPGPSRQRAAYAPALVGFVGSNGGNLNLGNGRAGVGWFPLAPGEAWRPPYPASPGYLARLNRAGFARDNTNGYYYQTRPGAVTAVGAGDFGRRPVQSARQGLGQVPAAELARGGLVAPPPGRGGRPESFGGGPGDGVRFERAPSLAVQPQPFGASPGDRMRQEQGQRAQEALQAQQRAEMLRQEQMRGGQDRFQPDFQQRQRQEQQQRQNQQVLEQQQQYNQRLLQQQQQHNQLLIQQQQQVNQQLLQQQQQRQAAQAAQAVRPAPPAAGQPPRQGGNPEGREGRGNRFQRQQ